MEIKRLIITVTTHYNRYINIGKVLDNIEYEFDIHIAFFCQPSFGIGKILEGFCAYGYPRTDNIEILFCIRIGSIVLTRHGDMIVYADKVASMFE